MYEKGQQKLSTEDALNEIKKLISTYSIGKIDYIDGNEFSYETEEGKIQHFDILKLRDVFEENLFYVDNPEEFCDLVNNALKDKISSHTSSKKYAIFEITVKKANIGEYEVRYNINIDVDKENGGISILRWIKIIKVKEMNS